MYFPPASAHCCATPDSSTACLPLRCLPQVRYVVGGRILNVYAPDNPALAFLYRTDHPLSTKCSGLGAVHSHDVENFDASTHVPQGADAYHFAIPAVIEEVALLPCD